MSDCRTVGVLLWQSGGSQRGAAVGLSELCSGGLVVASNKLLSDCRNFKLWQSGGLSGLRALAVMLDSA